MAQRGTARTGTRLNDDCDEIPTVHHIATNKNMTARARGGPWTPRFEALFKRADMSLDDPANKISIKGHRGPHPEEYHQAVYNELEKAVGACSSTKACREALTNALHKLRDEISLPGSRLNRLLTQGCDG